MGVCWTDTRCLWGHLELSYHLWHVHPERKTNISTSLYLFVISHAFTRASPVPLQSCWSPCDGDSLIPNLPLTLTDHSTLAPLFLFTPWFIYLYLSGCLWDAFCPFCHLQLFFSICRSLPVCSMWAPSRFPWSEGPHSPTLPAALTASLSQSAPLPPHPQNSILWLPRTHTPLICKLHSVCVLLLPPLPPHPLYYLYIFIFIPLSVSLTWYFPPHSPSFLAPVRHIPIVSCAAP